MCTRPGCATGRRRGCRSRPAAGRCRQGGGAHALGAGVAGEDGTQRHQHLLGRGEHPELTGGRTGHAQRQQGGTEAVVGKGATGDGGGARRVPGGLDGPPPGVAQGGLQEDQAVRGQPLPTIRSSGSACTATSRRTGPSGPSAVQPIRKPRRRWASARAHSGTQAAGSGNASPSSAPPPSRASASYARRALVLPLPLGPAIRVRSPRRRVVPRCPAKAESSSSVTRGSPGRRVARPASAGACVSGAAGCGTVVTTGWGGGGGVMRRTLNAPHPAEPFRRPSIPTDGRHTPVGSARASAPHAPLGPRPRAPVRAWARLVTPPVPPRPR